MSAVSSVPSRSLMRPEALSTSATGECSETSAPRASSQALAIAPTAGGIEEHRESPDERRRNGLPGREATISAASSTPTRPPPTTITEAAPRRRSAAASQLAWRWLSVGSDAVGRMGAHGYLVPHPRSSESYSSSDRLASAERTVTCEGVTAVSSPSTSAFDVLGSAVVSSRSLCGRT